MEFSLIQIVIAVAAIYAAVAIFILVYCARNKNLAFGCVVFGIAMFIPAIVSSDYWLPVAQPIVASVIDAASSLFG